MVEIFINEVSKWMIPIIITFIPVYAYVKGIKVYEVFIEGAEDGFKIAIKLIPYLVAMLVAVGIFRNSGAMEMFVEILKPVTSIFNIPGEILPLALMRPFSGGASLGIATELINTYGADSIIGRIASTMQGSSDTTFFVLAVYFGSVGIKKYRHAPWVGLTADLTTFLVSVYIVNKVF
ncbi:spore maturation protein B [Desulfonispora thiosulfatigenes DSM 11270]|uniref:Spore maturation protein B n=1 Tax=Desulfonispora thiosulfatigenes DSM 11270 TaxID=656914 RepID=A0A1W1VM60_DESTI|nr:spore maturation protein [Desulfonispora thiosulfatigenes]SMB94373.1 spore maturation protein B [Desulfonispora thiosulfatigenes DSM 11270]